MSVENRDIIHNFLVWSNCEYLNEQLRYNLFDLQAKNQKEHDKQKNYMRGNLTYNGEIQLEAYRFPFYIYKTNKPDIEHVDPDIAVEEQEGFFADPIKCNSWLYDVFGDLEKDFLNEKLKDWWKDKDDGLKDKTNIEVDEIISNLKLEEDKVKNNLDIFKDTGSSSDYYESLIDYFADKVLEGISKDEENSFDTIYDRKYVGNICLLDSNINRSYQNAPFRIKRRDIIEKGRYGRYIYPCTKMIFLKEFSTNTKNLQKWTKDDFEGYRNFLINLFYDCFYVDQKETDKKISEEKNEKDLRNIPKQYFDTILGGIGDKNGEN